MTLMSDIRAQMARESGPVRPAQIAEALDVDALKVRNAMAQGHTKGAGIERHEDGTFSLIPGWKPTRGPNVGEAAAAETPAPARAPKREAAVSKKFTTKKPPHPTKPRRVAAVESSVSAAEDLVPIPRTTLRLLVVEMLESDRPISLDGRQALLALIRPAA